MIKHMIVSTIGLIRFQSHRVRKGDFNLQQMRLLILRLRLSGFNLIK